MHDEGLLVRLINHRLSPDRARHEDYLTECLAWLMEEDSDLRGELLRRGGLIFRGAGAVRAPNPDVVVRIRTQVQLSPQDRPDVMVDSEGFRLLIEAKVDAEFDEGQIGRYLRHVDLTSKGGVVSIVRRTAATTTTRLDADARFLGVVTWASIGERIEELPETSECVANYRRWFLRLLNCYGLVRVTGPLAWDNTDETQDVDEVKRLCTVLDDVCESIRTDESLIASAPAMYLVSPGAFRLEPHTQRSGTGPMPRPILYHHLELQTPWSPFLNFRLTVYFRDSKYTRASAGATTCAEFCSLEWKGKPGFFSLNALRRALADALPEDDGEALAALAPLHEPFMRRAEAMLALFGEQLRESPIPVPSGARSYRDWSLNYPVAPTSALVPPGADAEEIRDRYAEWTRAVLSSFFAVDPLRPFLELERALREAHHR